MNIRCLLVDDEPPALRVLQHHLAKLPGLEIIGTCKNALDAMDILHRKPVDLLFLDIKMPRLLGTDFLRGITNPPKVIFVTAYRHFAAETYELDAVDYLLKPVSFERLVRAVSKAKGILNQREKNNSEDFLHNPEAFIYLKVDKSMQKILIDQILYFESLKDYVKVFLAGGREFLVKQPISAIANLLAEHSFLRVHRSYIVSIRQITGYSHVQIQIHQTQIPIGRFYKRQTIEALEGVN